jgi:acyl transferase domain-containing protein/acyl carrier protein
MIKTPDDPTRKELLKTAYLKLQELQERLAAYEAKKHEPIAVIGMGCRFPGGVTDPESMWQLLRSGTNGVREVPPERWDVDAYYDPDPDAPRKMYSRRGGFLDDVRGFDPPFFGISPHEAGSLDPQHRLLLEVTWEALENAGQAPAKLVGTPTGVFVGIAAFDYAILLSRTFETGDATMHTASGIASSTAAGRISYFLGLRGPAMSVDTACSSSLMTVHLACQSLRAGECSMALAGGVNLIISPEGTAIVCKARMLAHDGHCKTFDASADGYVRSEGCGIVVLKPLSQARADGDRILAVIHGTASNQDGRTSGLTAPSGLAQKEVMQTALAASGIGPRDVGFIEAHGTGTSLGDPIEMQAIGELHAPVRTPETPLVVGAIKSNLGHMESAAGVASLIKAILVLQHEEVPPQLHFRNPNPHIPWKDLPVVIPTKPLPWPAHAKRRIAGVSSYGFSGTNVHVILEQAPHEATPASAEAGRAHVLTLSAKSEAALHELACQYANYLDCDPSVAIGDVCFTANTGRAQFSQRLVVVGSSAAELSQKLRDYDAGLAGSEVFHGEALPGRAPRLAFLFPDKAAVPADLGRRLYDTEPAFRAAIDQCDALAQGLLGCSLREQLYPSGAASHSPARPAIAQATHFATSHALAELWRSWGVVPDVVLGEGAGELAAACAAGALSVEDGLRLAIERGRLPGATAGSNGSGVRLSEPKSDFVRGSSAIIGTALRELHTQGCRLVLAIGTDAEALEQSRQALAPAECTWLPTVRSGEDHDRTISLALAALAVAGAPVDWDVVYRNQPRRRLALPTYPFQRQPYWVKITAPSPLADHTAKYLHPLLGRRITSPRLGKDVLLEGLLATNLQPFLKDHCIFKTFIVPSTAYLEMAQAAGGVVFGRPGGAVEQFAIQGPMILSEGRPRTVQTILTPTGADTFSFSICSVATEDEENTEAWKQHAEGTIRRPAEETVPPEVSAQEQAQWPARCQDEVATATCYEKLRSSGVEYGPTFRAVTSIHRRDGEVLGRLRLPDSAEGGAYRFHPGLLDGALQLLGLALPTNMAGRSGGSVYLPMGIEHYQVYRAPEGELVCHGTVRADAGESRETFQGDVQLFDAEGNVVAELRGVRFKRATSDALQRQLAQQNVAGWLFETRWQPVDPAATGDLPPPVERWLIFADSRGRGDALAARLREREQACTLVLSGEAFASRTDGSFTVRPAVAEDMDRLLQAVVSPGTNRLPGIVHLWATEVGTSLTDAPADAARQCASVLHLVQAAVRAGGDAPILALVTYGAQAASGPADVTAPAGSALWGLGRVIAVEQPTFNCKCIDLDPKMSTEAAADAILEELLEGDRAESQLALRKDGRHVARLVRAEPRTQGGADSLALPEGPTYQLVIPRRGDLGDLELRPQKVAPPGPGEVQVRVLATGLNFRDVLNALGMYPGDPGPLGSESVGVIEAVGPGVTGWAVGDRVVGMTPGSFCTIVNVPTKVVFPYPEGMTTDEAATVLVVFLTSAYSLHTLGGMKVGHRVLIHAGAGGVGLAAIQLAQRAGAEVFATAGSPVKRDYLRSLGVKHVFDSRSVAFAEEIRQATNGEGIDLVLNSLTGESIVKSMSLLRPSGHFLEIGKTDLWDDERVARTAPGIKYHIIDLAVPSYQQPELIHQVWAELLQGFADGSLRPLRHRVFPIQEARAAFRYMAGAKHIGKIVVSQPEHPVGPVFRERGTYLITGGLGGLGLCVARWMVEQGARRLVLVGRSVPTPAAEEVLKELRGAGAEVVAARADVSQYAEVARLLSEVPASAQLRGIVHAAGVLDDGTLTQQSAERFSRVLAPKVQGAWNLHWLTRAMDLDFFVMFASGAGLLGNAGQGSYAAGNTFLDGLAHLRAAAGLPALSIDWGPWAKVGMAAAMAERHQEGWAAMGLGMIEPAQGIEALERTLAWGLTQAAVLPFDKAKFQARLGAGKPMPFFSVVFGGPSPATTEGPALERANFLAQLQEAPAEHRRELAIDFVRDAVRHAFGFSSTMRIAVDQNLTSLGMDSLMAVQLTNRLKNTLGQPFPPTFVFEHPTLEAIADYILALFSRPTEAAAAEAKRPALETAGVRPGDGELNPTQAEQVLQHLDQLSDAEVDAMLGTVLNEGGEGT